jgi:hypothetical protein
MRQKQMTTHSADVVGVSVHRYRDRDGADIDKSSEGIVAVQARCTRQRIAELVEEDSSRVDRRVPVARLPISERRLVKIMVSSII